jgi:replication-associated recombination protein RarA
MEHEAVHFAVELEEFNPTMLWNRLKVIAAEDIGPANPQMPILIDVLQKNYLAEKSKLGENNADLYLADAVVCLCFSQKSRVTDDLLNVVTAEREHGKYPPIPEFALDMHTARGKALGKGIEDFFSEGNKLENEAFNNRYTEKAKELLKNSNRKQEK